MKIWKWNLEVNDYQELMIPRGAKILAVQSQGKSVTMWAECDESATLETRRIAIYGTGHVLPDRYGKYIGTFQIHEGELGFHVYELT